MVLSIYRFLIYKRIDERILCQFFINSFLQNKTIFPFLFILSYPILQQEIMFIPIFEWNDLEEFDEPISGSSCGCCKIDPNNNERGTSICTDCKCHLRTSTRNHPKNIWTDPILLYGVISAAMMVILFLASK